MTTIKNIGKGLALLLFLAAAPAYAQSAQSAVDTMATAHSDAQIAAANRAVNHGKYRMAREDMERAETALLNEASYDGQLKIAQGTGVVLSGKLQAIAEARQALAARELGQVRTELAAAE